MNNKGNEGSGIEKFRSLFVFRRRFRIALTVTFFPPRPKWRLTYLHSAGQSPLQNQPSGGGFFTANSFKEIKYYGT